MCSCVYQRARANTRRGLFLLPFSVACISPALSAPFTPFRSPSALFLSPALSHCRWRTFFSCLRTKIGRLPRGERTRSGKWEGSRERKSGWGPAGGGAGAGRNRKREAPAERARGKAGEPRGSIGGHRPPQKSARYHPPGYVRRVDGGDDARFINICRRTLNSSLVANENRYRVWSWRTSTCANLTAHYGAP